MKRAVAASIGLALLVFALYSAGTRFSRTSQPRPVVGPSKESALRLNAVLSDRGKPLPRGVEYHVYEVAKNAEGERKAIADSTEFDGPPRFALPPGRYYVTATHGWASASTDVEVSAGKITIQTLNLRGGLLLLGAVLAAGGTPLARGVRYDIYEAAQDVEGKRKRITDSETYQDPPRLVLPAGRYYVTAASGAASAAREIVVRAGDEPVREMLDLRAGILSLSAVLAAGSTPLSRGVRYDVYEAAKDAEGKWKPVTHSEVYEDPPRFPLPAGRYHVSAKHGSASAAMDVDVAAGDNPRRQALDLHAGVLSVSAVSTAGREPLTRGVRYVVYKAERVPEGQREQVTSSERYEGPPRFVLPAGRYYVSASAEAGNGDADVTVAPGATQTIQVRLSTARLR